MFIFEKDSSPRKISWSIRLEMDRVISRITICTRLKRKVYDSISLKRAKSSSRQQSSEPFECLSYNVNQHVNSKTDIHVWWRVGFILLGTRASPIWKLFVICSVPIWCWFSQSIISSANLSYASDEETDIKICILTYSHRLPEFAKRFLQKCSEAAITCNKRTFSLKIFVYCSTFFAKVEI